MCIRDSPVTVAACSPDGRWMVTGTQDQINKGSLRVWNLQNRREHTILATNLWFAPNSTIFSPDSQWIASVDIGSGVHVWNVATSKEVTNMPRHNNFTDPVGIAFSPDSQTLAYCENEQGDIVLWDIPSQSRKLHLKGHRLWVMTLAFTPDGRALISSGIDKTTRLWNLSDGLERGSFTNLSLNAEYFRISPDGTVLATTSKEQQERVLLQQMPSGVRIGELIGHQHALTDAAFSPDGKSMITASLDGTARLWPVTPAPKNDESRQYSGKLVYEGGGGGTALCPTPDGRNLLAVCADDTFTIWDTLALSESAREPVPVTGFQCAAFAPGARTAAFIGKGGTIVLWHAESTHRQQFSLPTKSDSVRAAFSPDAQRLAIAGEHRVYIFNPVSEDVLFEFPVAEGPDHGDPMCLSFSRDGRKLLVGFYFGRIEVWNLSPELSRVVIQANSRVQVRGLGLLDDGETLVSVGGEVSCWNLKSQTKSVSFKPRATAFRGCAISADGRRLVVGAQDGLLTIWDLASRQELITLRGDDRIVNHVFFLGDGDTLMAIGLDHVRLWHAPSRSETDDEPMAGSKTGAR